mmetsp:Transcript_20099/g.61920  ORF Transcript_20099/g.61920 Transcript_20099/m.61920 type:complete len:179 (-) Transcript_20099:3-539(-)
MHRRRLVLVCAAAARALISPRGVGISPRRARARLANDPRLPEPDPIFNAEAVVALLMNALGRNDDPTPDRGLTLCFAYSDDMCRAAVGGSLDAFLQYARNPTFSQLIDHQSWSGKVGTAIPASQTRGAMQTSMVTVVNSRGQTRKFLWTMQQQRRPPRQGVWLVHECLNVDMAFAKTE